MKNSEKFKEFKDLVVASEISKDEIIFQLFKEKEKNRELKSKIITAKDIFKD